MIRYPNTKGGDRIPKQAIKKVGKFRYTVNSGDTILGVEKRSKTHVVIRQLSDGKIDVRTFWSPDDDGVYVPTKKGSTVSLSALVDALENAVDDEDELETDDDDEDDDE